MSRFFRLAVLAATGLAVAGAGSLPTASAAMTRTMHLHGGMYTHKAMATARVTEVSKDDYRIQITASGLPAPEMLHVKPQRHAYIAWVVDGMDKHAMMGAVPLTLDKASGVYSANRVVMIQHVTRIVVTADKSAMQHMATMPETIVLDSAMKGGM
jgi:hypothetical protein